jgi:hypothetical protein
MGDTGMGIRRVGHGRGIGVGNSGSVGDGPASGGNRYHPSTAMVPSAATLSGYGETNGYRQDSIGLLPDDGDNRTRNARAQRRHRESGKQ